MPSFISIDGRNFPEQPRNRVHLEKETLNESGDDFTMGFSPGQLLISDSKAITVDR